MREIKLRIIKDEKIAGYVTFKGALAQYDFLEERPKNFPENIHPDMYCSSARLERYTGLKDKNGREIYEGDWLNARNSLTFGIHPEWGRVVAKVVWDEESLSWHAEVYFPDEPDKQKRRAYFFLSNLKDLEVIDNPELLEGKP